MHRINNWDAKPGTPIANWQLVKIILQTHEVQDLPLTSHAVCSPSKTKYFTPWPTSETVNTEKRALELACIGKLILAHVLFGLGLLIVKSTVARRLTYWNEKHLSLGAT